MRLTKAQQAARARIEDAIARDLPLEQLGAEIIGGLGEAIPNDGYRLLGIDPETLLVNRLIAASDDDDWARSEWLREVYLHADPISYIELHELMRMNLRAAASHERQDDCWGIPRAVLETVPAMRHTEAFHELRSPTGGTLFGCFPARGRWFAALQIYRRDGAPPFRRSDVAFLESLSLRIGAALDEAARRDAIAAAVCGDVPRTASDAPGGGVLFFNSFGSAAFQTEAGLRWLAAIGGSERRLPEAIQAALAKARKDAHGLARVTIPSALGLVRVDVSRAANNGGFAAVFSPARQHSDLVIPPDWDLTPTEARVAELALRGLNNADIAAQLYVSPETARTHLRHIYEKLDVGSRTQLMARYFHTTHKVDNPG